MLKRKFNIFSTDISQDQTQVSITDQVGRAEITVDGCVELMTFEVNPPTGSRNGGYQCFEGGKSNMDGISQPKDRTGMSEKIKSLRSIWNVRKIIIQER